MNERITEGHFVVSVSKRAVESGAMLENLLGRLGATDEGKAVLTGGRSIKLPNRVRRMWESMGPAEQLNFIIESFIEPPAEQLATEQAKTDTASFLGRGL